MSMSWIGERFVPRDGRLYYAGRVVFGRFEETVLYECTSHYVCVHVYDMIDANMLFFRSIDDVWKGRYEPR